MKTPIKYYGGKQNMVSHILPLIPEHLLYCEPFFGGGAVYFAKPPSEIEVINDLNGEVINFYRVTQTHFNDLKYEVNTTLHSRDQHRQAQVVYHNPDMFNDVKRAWAFWVLSSQSFSGNITGGWGYDKSTNGTCKQVHNKKVAFTYEYQSRLQRVQVECNDALKVIRSRDTERTFYYCDPPYFNSDCGHYKGYSQHDFTGLLDTLASIKGKFLLSSYPSEILSEYVTKYGWQQKSVTKAISVSYQTKKTKVEMLTANYAI